MKFTFKILLLSIIFTSCSNNEDNSECSYTPTLLTKEVSNIKDISAIFEGQIIAPTCESTVTSQGFVYAKTTLPKTDDFVVEVNGENILTEVTNLEQNTKYYIRTFFVNPTGEYYGNQIEFTTSVGNLNITTKTIKNITLNSCLSGGIINDDGNGTIITKGVCWSTSQNPTINDNQIPNTSNNDDFNSEITGLLENTTYYVRAYATNKNGTTYGNVETFTTPSSTYKVELKITGHTNGCGVKAQYFYYEINYKFDDKNTFNAGEGFEGTSHNHSEKGKILNNLEVSIHLAQFNPNSPSETFKGTSVDMSIVITNIETNKEVVNKKLPALFICTDVAYKNIINFNPINNSFTIEQLTYGF